MAEETDTFDVLAALDQWVELHDTAERLHAALPPSAQAAIETSGQDIGGLAAWLATLPVDERLKLRSLTEALRSAMRGEATVSRQMPQRCHDHRPRLRPGA